CSQSAWSFQTSLLLENRPIRENLKLIEQVPTPNRSTCAIFFVRCISYRRTIQVSLGAIPCPIMRSYINQPAVASEIYPTSRVSLKGRDPMSESRRELPIGW